MKRGIRLVLSIFLLITICFIGQAQSLSIRGGGTMLPGLYSGIRYSHYTNSTVNLAGGIYFENANINSLRYKVSGVDVLAEYATIRNPEESLFDYTIGFGATAQIESEPWVYKGWPLRQRINYGVLSELAGIWNMTEVFSLSVFVQQKFWFNKSLGSAHLIYGLGLTHHFSQ